MFTERNTRMEVLIPEGMRAWMKHAAKLRGLTESGYLKNLVASDLSRTYGDGWIQGHPQGDHGEDPLVPGQLIEAQK